MTHDVTCMLTAKNRDQLRNPTLGNRVWALFATQAEEHPTFTFTYSATEPPYRSVCRRHFRCCLVVEVVPRLALHVSRPADGGADRRLRARVPAVDRRQRARCHHHPARHDQPRRRRLPHAQPRRRRPTRYARPPVAHRMLYSLPPITRPTQLFVLSGSTNE